MANRIAVVAPVASTSAAQAESRALSLNVAQALAVVALLRLGGAGHGALVRLVVWLLAWIHVSDRSEATGEEGSYSCSRAGGEMRKPRHGGQAHRTCSTPDERLKTF
jgi:hypothetical protein